MTGHAALMGTTHCVWHDTAYILRLFSPKPATARRAYRVFVEQGVRLGRRPDLVGGGLLRSHGGWMAVNQVKRTERIMSDERILVSSAFVALIMKHAREAYDKKTIARAMGVTLDEVIHTVADRISVDVALIRSSIKKRGAARARALVCSLAIDAFGICGARIAAHLGITSAAVSNLAAKGRVDTVVQELRERITTCRRG
jgi:hypothetical protein